MKKVFMFILMMALVIPVSAMGAKPSLNIADLVEQTPAYWDEICQTAKGKEISIHAPILMPETDSFPVLSMERYIPDEATLEAFGETSHLRAGWNYVAANRNPQLEGELYGLDPVEVIHNLWEEEPSVDMYEVYAEGQEVSLGQAADELREMVKAVFGDDADVMIDAAYLMPALRNQTKKGKIEGIADMGTATGKGGYEIQGIQMMNGIPILGSAVFSTGFSGRAENVLSKGFGITRCRMSEYRDDNFLRYYFADMTWRQKAVIHEDIPLCSFEQVKESVRSLIEKGKIQQIHAMYLGYVIWLDPDFEYIKNPDKKLDEGYQQPCLMVPTWFVECEYNSGRDYSHAKGDSEMYDYRKSFGHRFLMINAQTGEVYDHNDESKERSYAPKIITW